MMFPLPPNHTLLQYTQAGSLYNVVRLSTFAVLYSFYTAL